MSFEAYTPLVYETSELDITKMSMTQKFTYNGEEIKVSLYQFSNAKKESAELLLALIQDFDNIVNTYDLLRTLDATRVIDRFRRCLSGTALQDWELIRQADPDVNQHTFTVWWT